MSYQEKYHGADINTIPNAMSATRLLVTPLMYKLMAENPAKHWWKAGLVALSDNADGAAARLGDKHPSLAALGLRRSEVGRKLDPIVDKVYTSAMILAGIKNRSIPKPLAAVALVQKAGVSAVTLNAERQQQEIHVTATGGLGEFATNLGLGGLMASPAVESLPKRTMLRAASIGLAAAGVAISSVAAVGYARQSALLPAEPTAIETNLEAFAGHLIPSKRTS